MEEILFYNDNINNHETMLLMLTFAKYLLGANAGAEGFTGISSLILRTSLWDCPHYLYSAGEKIKVTQLLNSRFKIQSLNLHF